MRHVIVWLRPQPNQPVETGRLIFDGQANDNRISNMSHMLIKSRTDYDLLMNDGRVTALLSNRTKPHTITSIQNTLTAPAPPRPVAASV